MAKGKNSPRLYRVVKFEIRPDEAQLAILRSVSDSLCQIFNDARLERLTAFETHVAPIYAAIKEAAKGGDEIRLAACRAQLPQAFADHGISLFDQINSLTPKRAADAQTAAVPRNWQEETLDTLDGAFKSFLALRKNGDYDARPPRERRHGCFSEIPGRFGFRLADDCSSVTLMCKKVAGDVPLTFALPTYQQAYLERMDDVKKFTLYRDQPDMSRPGRFWISIASERTMPEPRPFHVEELVFVSLGASFVGISSPLGEEVIELGRPDRHWKPKVAALEDRIKRSVRGSKAWRKRVAARATMFKLMAAQQKLHRRTLVCALLSHGTHFVVSDLVIRSKKGKLADGADTSRTGLLGLNWSAQNTGSIAYVVQWLEEKVKERGGSVRKHRLTGPFPPGKGRENKIPMARKLRDDFLTAHNQAA